ncbi:hypothetical protein KIH79_04315 [Bifidobacterium sp. 82T10]|uniref:Uncharacterized protein n=1 Tax=Bifidobacterium miconis TaxID=2834435 RepID=A0ABS6WDS3_9BIFI|nr:hypothetical protein [Bifidobacterium miconis]MBW3092188.1 hypothetical protein [Bifidobacterium miconis]
MSNATSSSDTPHATATPAWKPSVWTFLVPAILAVAALGGGYLLGGVQAIGRDVCLSDAIYDINGRTPSPVDLPTYHGPRLTRQAAGAYYVKAVDASWNDIQHALPTLAGNDLAAIHEQAAIVAKAMNRTADMLTARTWDDLGYDVTDALDDIVRQYGNLAQDAQYAAASIDIQDANNLMRDLIMFGNHADAALRDDLGLPAGTPFTPPFDIVAVADRGIYDAAANDDDRSIDDGKHIVDVTVRSNVAGIVRSVSLSLTVTSAKGRTVGTADGGMDGLALAAGQSVVVPVAIDPELATSGATLSLKTLWMRNGSSSTIISLEDADGGAAPADDSLSRLGALAGFRLR